MLAPTRLDLALKRADVLTSLGEAIAAEACLREAAERFPAAWEILPRLAQYAETKQDWGGAASIWAAARAAHPTRNEALEGLAAALLAAGRSSEAELVLDAAVALPGASVRLMMIHAKAACERGDGPAALTRWERLRAADPSCKEAWLGSLEARRQDGDAAAVQCLLDEAILYFGVTSGFGVMAAIEAMTIGDRQRGTALWQALMEAAPDDSGLRAGAFEAAWQLRSAPSGAPTLGETAQGQPDRPGSSALAGFFDPCPEVRLHNDRLRADSIRSLVDGPSAPPSVTMVSGAHILPRLEFAGSKGENPTRTASYGVYDSSGRIVTNSIHVGHRAVPEDPFGPRSGFRKLEGRWLFAGVAIPHLGHFLTECIGRSWAAGWLKEGFTGTIFITPAAVKVRLDAGFTDDGSSRIMARRLGSGAEAAAVDIVRFPRAVHLVREPTWVEELVVPTQLVALHTNFIAGHPLFAEHIQASVDLAVASDDGDTPVRVYVSRRHLAPDKGNFACEDLLEELFLSQGYLIVHPERISLVEQFKIYRRASHIVLAAGSACHVAALAMNGTQQIALLHRYKQNAGMFVLHMRGMGVRSLVEIDALKGYFMPCTEDGVASGWTRSGVRGPDRAVHVLDFQRLWESLISNGFVEGVIPSFVEAELPSRLAHSAEKLAASIGSAMLFRSY